MNLVIRLTQFDGKKACFEEERMGLLELKSFLKQEVVDGSDHVVLPSWVDDPRSDCCGWERVSCNSTIRRIVKLSLSLIGGVKHDCYNDFVFSSYLNATLFQSFKDLKTLNLSYNYIRWQENQGLLRLQQLETLDLSGNGLTSSHLQSLMELKSLKNLILSCNSFNGSFPTPELSGFENLETLDLSWNSLSDSPRELGMEQITQ
ncbi:hypothetical protein V6Z12_D01G040500 [Gossypium hirsutum]